MTINITKDKGYKGPNDRLTESESATARYKINSAFIVRPPSRPLHSKHFTKGKKTWWLFYPIFY